MIKINTICIYAVMLSRGKMLLFTDAKKPILNMRSGIINAFWEITVSEMNFFPTLEIEIVMKASVIKPSLSEKLLNILINVSGKRRNAQYTSIRDSEVSMIISMRKLSGGYHSLVCLCNDIDNINQKGYQK